MIMGNTRTMLSMSLERAWKSIIYLPSKLRRVWIFLGMSLRLRPRDIPRKIHTLPHLDGRYVIYCTLPFHTVLYCTTCILLYYNLLYTLQYYTMQYSKVLYCTVQYNTVLYCTVLYYTLFYSTVLYYTILYCTVLYHTVL